LAVESELKDFAVIVPVAASALALTFDVGYFYAADIHYFSFFSLTEHLVFAAPVMPLAIAMVASGGMASLFIKRRVGEPYQRPRILQWKVFVPIVLFLALGGLLVRSYSVAMLVVWIVLLYVIAVTLTLRDRITKTHVFGSVLVVAFGFSFFWGVDSLGLDVRREETSNIINRSTDTLQVKVLRAGDRGVLIYDLSTKEFGLLRWDGIGSISSKTMPITFWEQFKHW
jgi:hypothetical protein